MNLENYDRALDRAAQLCGVEPEFWDIFGNRHVTSRETKKAFVAALGIPTSDEQSLVQGMAREQDAEWTRAVPPSRVVSVHEQPVHLPIHIPATEDRAPVRIGVTLEDGKRQEYTVELAHVPVAESVEVAGVRFVRKEVALPGGGLPLGYHTVRVSVPGQTVEMRLIVTPDRAYLPRFLEEGGRSAGIAVTLYGVRSAENWGCGDLRDLRNLCEWAAKDVGVSFIALNPLHAIHNRQPYNASPYLPNSIFYRNFIYLNVEAIEGFQESSEARALWASAETQKEIQELRASGYVEYERLHVLKLRFLRLTFEWSQKNPDPWRAAHFAVYLEKEGDLLYRFATYCALDEHLHGANADLWVWPEWPAGYQSPESAETRVFQEEHADAILFHQYVQWQITRQLGDAQEHAKRCGMGIGLYHDLALATDRCGSDLWAHGPFYVHGSRVGSPPDDFSPDGQDWAFPPPNKNQHRATGYQLFADSIRKTCSYGGALRIDHVMRFFPAVLDPGWGNGGAGCVRAGQLGRPDPDSGAGECAPEGAGGGRGSGDGGARGAGTAGAVRDPELPPLLL